MKLTAVTNNSLVYDNMSEREIFSEIIFDELFSHDDVLKMSEAMIIKGYKLLTSPFLGNLPQYETPFKTLVLAGRYDTVDFSSIKIIGKARQDSRKSANERTKAFWGKNDLDCFKKSDLVIVERWLLKVYAPNLLEERGVIYGI